MKRKEKEGEIKIKKEFSQTLREKGRPKVWEILMPNFEKPGEDADADGEGADGPKNEPKCFCWGEEEEEEESQDPDRQADLFDFHFFSFLQFGVWP